MGSSAYEPKPGPAKRRVRVRRSDRNPLAPDEYIEADADAAGQWDADQWHDRPTGRR